MEKICQNAFFVIIKHLLKPSGFASKENIYAFPLAKQMWKLLSLPFLLNGNSCG